MKSSRRKTKHRNKESIKWKYHFENKLFLAFIDLADMVRQIDDPDKMIKRVLKKVSAMMNIPLSCYCSIEDNKLIVTHFYSEKSTESSLKDIDINEEISSSLLKGHTCHIRSEESVTDSSNPVLKSLPGSHNILIIPHNYRSKGFNCFLFVGGNNDKTILAHTELLVEEILKVIQERLSILYLLDELRKINLELDKKISDRITELWETNRHLRAEIEEARKTDDELKLKNEELNHFVYRVAHDLRAPIISVEGLINIMKLELESKKGNLEPFILLLEDRMKHLDRFIQDILSYSRNIRTAINVEKIDFKKTIDSCFDELHYLDNAKDIQKIITINGSDFYNDRIRVYEIFRNLISNAIKYADKNKAQSKIMIRVQTNEKMTEINIRDNGIGMSGEILPRIYDMFFRGHESSKGSGIGLYLVRQSIEKMQGRIKVRSTPEKGTEFKIYLPNISSSG